MKRFVLASTLSISCRHRNNGIWFTLVMNLNSTCLDLMVRVKIGNANLLNALRKLGNLEGERNGVRDNFFSGIEPIVRFHNNINASVYKELPHLYALSHLRKGAVETPIFIQDNAPCHKAKTVLSFLVVEGITVMKRPPQSPDVNPL